MATTEQITMADEEPDDAPKRRRASERTQLIERQRDALWRALVALAWAIGHAQGAGVRVPPSVEDTYERVREVLGIADVESDEAAGDDG